MIEVSFAVTGEQAVYAQFERFLQRAQDMRFLFQRLKGTYQDFINRAFVSQGPGWAPNRPLTVMKKGSSTVLTEHGRLRASYLGGDGHVENMSSTSVEWGSELRQAAPLEDGFFNKGRYPGSRDGSVPARWMRGTPVVARPVFRMMTAAEEQEFVDRFDELLVQELGL